MAPATDMSPPRPPFFSRASGPGSTKSNPSSLKSFSLKGRKSFFSSLLSKSASRSNLAVDSKSKSRQDVAAAVTKPDLKEKALPPAPTRSSENSAPAEKKATHRSNEPQHSQPSSSHSLIRRISTTLLRSSPDTPPHRVPHPTASSRHLREAALRERGLLPAKDLSSLEREQDRRLSIVYATPPEALDDAGVTAANRIKQEWESKNGKSADALQREKLASFKFGGVSSSTAPGQPRPSLDPVVEVESPIASPVSVRFEKAAAPLVAFSTSGSTLADPDTSDQPELTSSPSDPEFKAFLVPLPPSPTTKKSDASSVKSGKPVPPPISLPSVPSGSSPASPSSVKSAKSISSTAKGVTPRSSSSSSRRPKLIVPTEPLPHSPTASPTSPSSCAEGGSLAPPAVRSRSRSRTVPGPGSSESDESSSIATPSLDTSSQVTLDSALSLGTNKSKPNALAKTWTNERNIPVIVESPGEDSNGFGLSISTETIPDAIEEFGVTKEKSLAGTPIPRRSATVDPNYPNGHAAMMKEKGERRMSLTLFKRGNDSSTNLAEGRTAPKLSKSTSFSNFRRTVVGTLSRGGSSAKGGQPSKGHHGFDASHLPASPTAPASLANQTSQAPDSVAVTSGMASSIGGRGRGMVNSDGRTTGVGPRQRPIARQAISPTMHSRGSILFEMNAIEDDETRRMTEMAFLG